MNSINNKGDTPLHVAARKNNEEDVNFILANVNDKNPVNQNGDTPLQEAANNGFLDICISICQHLKDKDFMIGRELVYSVLWVYCELNDQPNRNNVKIIHDLELK